MAEALQPEDEDVHSDSTEYYTSSEEDDDSESLNTGSVKELTNCGNTYHSVFVDTIKHAIEDDQLITSNCGQEVLQVLKRVKVNSDSLPTREIARKLTMIIISKKSGIFFPFIKSIH